MFSILILAWLTCAAAEEAIWPGFLGAGRTELDPDTLPLTWTFDSGIAWASPIPGHGQSSPVIWGDQVYVTSVEGPNKEVLHVLCYQLDDGSLLWDQTHPSSNPEKNSLYISRAAPTPVVDALGVYCYFEGGDVLALAHSGNLLWRCSLAEELGPPQNEFGLSASPVQLDDRIVLLIDDEGPSCLVALSKSNGEILWKTDRASRRSWSSPALIRIEGEWQIVCSSGGTVDGYDPREGNLLWSFTEVGGNTGTTPWMTGEGSFLVGAAPGREGQNAENAKRSNGLMTVRRSGTGWNPEFSWLAGDALPSWASPIVHQGCAYWINRSGVVFCLDSETGELHYAERTRQSAWATPLGAGDRVYFFGKDGLTTVLASGPEFRLLAENQLWDPEAPPPDDSLHGSEEETGARQSAAAMFAGPTLYGVAAVNGSLILRTGTMLYCVRQ